MSASTYPLRLPAYLMEQAKQVAEASGSSLNQFFLAAIAERVPGAHIKVLCAKGERLSDHDQDVGSYRYCITNLAAPSREELHARYAVVEQLLPFRFAEPDGRVPATFQFLTMTGWRPHESQQKPLKPGSGAISLTEALKPRSCPSNGTTKVCTSQQVASSQLTISSRAKPGWRSRSQARRPCTRAAWARGARRGTWRAAAMVASGISIITP